MSALLAALARLIGWGGVLCILLFFFEEGIPGASRIPFLSSIPIIGDLTTGRVHTYAADQVKFATAASDAKWGLRMQTMVSQSELDAANTLLAKARTEAAQNAAVAEAARKQADDARIETQKAKDDLNARIAADTGPDGGTWTDNDSQWMRHR